MLKPPYVSYPTGKLFCTHNKQKRLIAHFFDRDQMRDIVPLLNGQESFPAELRIALLEWIRAEDETKPIKGPRELVMSLARKWLDKPVQTGVEQR